MGRDERAPAHWRALDEAFPDGAPQALVDALDAADRAAELAEGTIAALRDRIGELERRRTPVAVIDVTDPRDPHPLIEPPSPSAEPFFTSPSTVVFHPPMPGAEVKP